MPPPAAEAQLRAAESGLVQAKLNVEYASITAPVTGRTCAPTPRWATWLAGEPVLTTLVSSDRVYAYFDVSKARLFAVASESQGRRAREASGSTTRPATPTPASWTSSTTA